MKSPVKLVALAFSCFISSTMCVGAVENCQLLHVMIPSDVADEKLEAENRIVALISKLLGYQSQVSIVTSRIVLTALKNGDAHVSIGNRQSEEANTYGDLADGFAEYRNIDDQNGNYNMYFSKDYAAECANIGSLLRNIYFTDDLAKSVADTMSGNWKKPEVAMAEWVRTHEDTVRAWLRGVTSADGSRDGFDALHAALGM